MTNTKVKTNGQTRENLNVTKLISDFLFVRTNQINKMAMMLVFVVVLMTGAVIAQEKGGDNFAPVGHFTGMQTVQGTSDLVNLMRYGNSFALNSFGEWETHHLSISLDYSTNSFISDEFIVTGGSWSLVVIRENQYVGTLYGVVESGTINLITNSDGKLTSKTIYTHLRATGGLGIFQGRASEAIRGVYNMNTDLRSNSTSGNADFTF